MLRQFGFVTLIDLTVSLVGVLLVLPAVLALADRRRRERAADRGAPATGRDAAFRRRDRLRVEPSRRPPDARAPAATSRRGWIRTRRASPDAIRAAGRAGGAPAERPAPVIDTRRYQRMIGADRPRARDRALGHLFVNHAGAARPASPRDTACAGSRRRWRPATCSGAANLHPPCTLARHDPRALNLCIDAGRGPIVLSLFVLGGGPCERQVDALQTLSRRFAGSSVQFVAVARQRQPRRDRQGGQRPHWTIPVAYDEDGASESSTASWPVRWSSSPVAAESSPIA